MGTCIVMKEEYESEECEGKNQITKEELFMLKDIPSMPYQLDFAPPVVKVTCGDGFNALLTAQGQVFTWGHNKFNQLGIDRSDICV